MNKCKCTVDETTGWTQVKCCNICGKPVEDFWNVPEPIGKMYSGKDVADMMRAAYKSGCKIDLKELQPVLDDPNFVTDFEKWLEARNVKPKLQQTPCTTQICPYCQCEAVGFGGACGDNSLRCMEC